MKNTGLIVRVPKAGTDPAQWESLDITELNDYQTAWLARTWSDMPENRRITYIETLLRTIRGMALDEDAEWVSRKRFDELRFAHNELVTHHAKHHQEPK